MGTRSITRFVDDEGKEICCLYRQFDGYPSEHGKDLAKACDYIMSSGVERKEFERTRKLKRYANGIEELAILAITNLKRKMLDGNLYMHATGTHYASNRWIEYVYTVRMQNLHRPPHIECKSQDGQVVFEGTPKDWAKYVKQTENAHAS